MKKKIKKIWLLIIGLAVTLGLITGGILLLA